MLLSHITEHTIQYWRSTSGFEVDFLLDEKTAVEINAAKKINSSDLKGLYAIREEFKELNLIVACQVEKPMQFEGVLVMPIEMFLRNLWSGNIHQSRD